MPVIRRSSKSILLMVYSVSVLEGIFVFDLTVPMVYSVSVLETIFVFANPFKFLSLQSTDYDVRAAGAHPVSGVSQ